MDGGTQKFIALGNIRNLEIDVPSDKEQIRIGQYFEQFDHLITLHQWKCEENKINRIIALEQRKQKKKLKNNTIYIKI
jgi:restriction endonuclease S subunit